VSVNPSTGEDVYARPDMNLSGSFCGVRVVDGESHQTDDPQTHKALYLRDLSYHFRGNWIRLNKLVESGGIGTPDRTFDPITD
jgi:hypothetical protein